MTIRPDRSLELLLLGGFDVRVNGISLAGFSYGKMRALLAYLAVEQGQSHHRETLAEMLWADVDAVTARGNLRRTLSHLRTALEAPPGKELFLTDKSSIRFLPEAYVDAVEFTRLQWHSLGSDEEERIANLYRGEFLAGLQLPGCPDFENWLQLKREALRRGALALLEHLSTEREQAGKPGDALRFALRHAELDPWSEEAHRRVMRLYALQGQKSAALSQYEACCRELKAELGALPGEETRQLAECIRAGELQPTAPEVLPARTKAPVEFERRQVTALYCELALPENDDPDETMVLLQVPQARCEEAIRHHNGQIVQTHGGGLLAYFGYPQASEHAARHAVQAALAIVGESGGSMKIRVGIHTGMTITGGLSAQPDASGNVSRQATQLRLYAPSNGVAISSATHAITAGYFECDRLGLQTLPGIDRPVELFRPLRESGAHTRVAAALQLTPLVGREPELAMLTKLWEAAARGEGQAVLIRGEAGIGKTRLLHALKESLNGTPCIVRELRCFPEYSQSPYHPLIRMIERAFGFTHSDSQAEKYRKLVAHLADHFPALMPEAVSLLANLLYLPPNEQYPLSGMSTRKLKESTQSILLEIMRTRASREPVLFIVEDLHWIDPSTLEFLTRVVDTNGTRPVLLLLTARPEFSAPWPTDRVTQHTLKPLADTEMVAMVAALDANMPSSTVKRIIALSDGVPLFAEEMVKITNADKQISVPGTLMDLLAARIDRTGEAKRTAQFAAALGREFDLGMLRRVSPDGAGVVAGHLEILQDTGLIFANDEDTWQFKHALIREAVSQSPIKADRQGMHRRIVQVLQTDFVDLITVQPELLAQHLEGAGEIYPAIEQWIVAGRHASSRFADIEAVGHFKSALSLLSSLPPGLDRDQAEFKIIVNYCPALYATKGYGAKEANELNIRIEELSARIGDSPDLFEALWATDINRISAMGSRGMPERVERLLRIAGDDPVRKLAAHFIGCNSSLWLGDFAGSVAHYEQVIALNRPELRQAQLERYGSDLTAFAYVEGMNSLFSLGYPDQSLEICRQVVQRERMSAHPPTAAMVLTCAGNLYRWMNMPEEALEVSSAAAAIAEQYEIQFWLAGAKIMRGWALVVLGKCEEGIVDLNACVDGMTQAAGGISVIFLSGFIESYLHLKQYDEVLRWVEITLAEAERTGDNHYLAELYRAKGECLLHLFPGDAAQAEAFFNQALALSRAQQARIYELRAAISLARLWQQQGKSAEARALLEGVYNWFTEGFETRDLQVARELLALL